MSKKLHKSQLEQTFHPFYLSHVVKESGSIFQKSCRIWRVNRCAGSQCHLIAWHVFFFSAVGYNWKLLVLTIKTGGWGFWGFLKRICLKKWEKKNRSWPLAYFLVFRQILQDLQCPGQGEDVSPEDTHVTKPNQTALSSGVRTDRVRIELRKLQYQKAGNSILSEWIDRY